MGGGWNLCSGAAALSACGFVEGRSFPAPLSDRIVNVESARADESFGSSGDILLSMQNIVVDRCEFSGRRVNLRAGRNACDRGAARRLGCLVIIRAV